MTRKKRTVAVRIDTERYGFPLPFSPSFSKADAEAFAEYDPDEAEEAEEREEPEENTEEPERSEFFAEGKLVETAERVEIVYEESVATGMEGSVTTIGFAKEEPDLVTMFRQGLVSTAFVFEKGVRHICVYNTPFSAFELCVQAINVRNRLTTDGTIELAYITELHGARAERCKMTIRVDG